MLDRVQGGAAEMRELAIGRNRPRAMLSKASLDSLDAAVARRVHIDADLRETILMERWEMTQGIDSAYAQLFNTMAADIRDGKVGFREEQRERMKALSEHPFLGRVGLHPFDAGTAFRVFILLALAGLAAFRLASITGRNPRIWSGVAFFFPPVLLFLLVAAPESRPDAPTGPS